MFAGPQLEVGNWGYYGSCAESLTGRGVHAHMQLGASQRRTPASHRSLRPRSRGAPIMPRSKKAKRGKEEGEETKEHEEAEEEVVKETGAQVVDNLLTNKRIATPHPNKAMKTWGEWTCNHCEKTFYPGQNFSQTKLRDCDIASAIVKHFRDNHASGPDSAYAEAAPNRYKLVMALYTEDGHIAPPAKIRRAFQSHAKGIWNKVHFPVPPPFCLALSSAVARIASAAAGRPRRARRRAHRGPPLPDRLALDHGLRRESKQEDLERQEDGGQEVEGRA